MTRLLFILATLVAPIVAWADLPTACGTLPNHYGPYDYRDPGVKENLNIVEPYHFTAKVEALTGGASSFKIPEDLNYTLRVFPNHHRALNSMAKFDLRGMARSSHGPLTITADCYFLRAIAWRPDDETVRLIYANYLFKKGDLLRATEQYEAALKIAPESAEVNYNYGLLLVEVGELQKAAERARVAYAGGYPLPGLRNKLMKAGVSVKSSGAR